MSSKYEEPSSLSFRCKVRPLIISLPANSGREGKSREGARARSTIETLLGSFGLCEDRVVFECALQNLPRNLKRRVGQLGGEQKFRFRSTEGDVAPEDDLQCFGVAERAMGEPHSDCHGISTREDPGRSHDLGQCQFGENCLGQRALAGVLEGDSQHVRVGTHRKAIGVAPQSLMFEAELEILAERTAGEHDAARGVVRIDVDDGGELQAKAGRAEHRRRDFDEPVYRRDVDARLWVS